MYTTHFGFDSKPFRVKDSKDLYHNANFDVVCADILDGIRERRGFILLTGEVGSGKTCVLRRCMAEADDIRFILLNNADLDFPDLINYLCGALQLPDIPSNTEQQGQRLLEALAAGGRRNQITALLIDDAHRIRINALSRLWEFVAVPSLPSRRLQVVLAGLPEIEGKLRQPDVQLVQDSIQIRCRLERLSDGEIGLFIAHQLEVAGYKGSDLLPPDVVERITAYCQGAPRAVASLCDAVLLLASLETDQPITPDLVDEAASNCFFGDQAGQAVVEAASRPYQVSAALTAVAEPALVGDADFDAGLPDLGFSFDFELDHPPSDDETTADETPAVATLAFEPEPVAAAVLEPPAEPEPVPPPAIQNTFITPDTAAMPASPPLRAFAQLLEEAVAKQDRHDARDRAAIHFFHHGYLRLLQGSSRARLTECEWRLARLAQIQQPVLVMLAIAMRAAPGSGGVLCALLINPSWWQYREIRLRVRSSELAFANDGQADALRLLGGRDAHPVYLEFYGAGAGSMQAGLRLEIDLCDHRGEWRAYTSQRKVRLNLPLRRENGRDAAKTPADRRSEQPRPDVEEVDYHATAGAWLLNASGSTTATIAGDLAGTLPLELEADAERSGRLNTAAKPTLNRGTPLTRALLLSSNPAYAPARIELVSRPFMLLGRYNAVTNMGFGDFALGFVPKYNRISRLHGVICALGDQLALMSASNQGHTYTGRNGMRLERGCWEFLETDDVLDICGLYRLRLTLGWDHRGECEPPNWDPSESRDKFGRYLLDLVDELQQRDPRADTDETQARLRNRYLNLLRAQEQATTVNGIGAPGVLLYARFEREDETVRQVTHYYLPKWLSLGSSSQAGLRITAVGVAPQHAELLFRDGSYWIQNLAEPGSVRVGCHGLDTHEAIALETGDILGIGAARFTFEAY